MRDYGVGAFLSHGSLDLYFTMNGIPRPVFKLAYVVPVACLILTATVSQTSVSILNDEPQDTEILLTISVVEMVAASSLDPPAVYIVPLWAIAKQ